MENTAKGTYLLVLTLKQALSQLAIGRLGQFDFAPGCYLYVGSAFGPGGLAARLAHHRRTSQHPHWHIDYLRRYASLHQIWMVAGPTRLECVWCQALAASPAFSIPVARFGARDTGCRTHLFYCERLPQLPALHTLLAADLPAVCGPLERIDTAVSVL